MLGESALDVQFLHRLSFNSSFEQHQTALHEVLPLALRACWRSTRLSTGLELLAAAPSKTLIFFGGCLASLSLSTFRAVGISFAASSITL